MNNKKLFERIRLHRNNIRFTDFIRLIEAFGFIHSHTNGSHQYYFNSAIPSVQLTLQPDKNGDAKPYQISQFLKIVDEYKLILGDNS